MKIETQEIVRKREKIVREIEKDFPGTFEVSESGSDAAFRILKEGRRLNQKDLSGLLIKIVELNKLGQMLELAEEFFPEPKEILMSK